MKNYLYSLLALVLFTLVACKKDPVEAPSPTPPEPTDSTLLNTLENRHRDTAYWYAQDIYLWADQLPAFESFGPRKFKDLNAIMMGIRPYSKEIIPGSSANEARDRWSFAVPRQEWDQVSQGIAQDFGMNVFFFAEGDLRVRFVEKNSPAHKAGIERGWQFTKINDITNIATGNANAIVNAVYGSNSGTFTFRKNDGSTATVNLTAGTYQSDPILMDTVITSGAHKVGYLVYNSFLGDQATTLNSFNRIFNRFTSAGINDLVVDLRYNGGGYVNLQEELANYIAPAAANGKIMMMQQFNDRYNDFNDTLFFAKKGNLELPRVFFIISDNTASASELLINNLAPFMTVRTVGPRPSYGKPVGYFPIPVGNQYIFPVSFRSTNYNRQGNYFNGFIPDRVVADGINRNWGASDEAPLASIMQFITTGNFGVAMPGANVLSSMSSKEKADVEAFNHRIGEMDLKITIDHRKLKMH